MTVKVSSKGQVTLTAEAQRWLGIRAGTKLEFIVKDGDRLDVVMVGGSVRTLEGALPRPRRTLSLAEMDDAVAAGAIRVRR